VWIDPALLTELAGERDEAWAQKFADMVAFAAGKGWVDDRGRLRAHIEVDTGEG
jgi:hypothetical protein